MGSELQITDHMHFVLSSQVRDLLYSGTWGIRKPTYPHWTGHCVVTSPLFFSTQPANSLIRGEAVDDLQFTKSKCLYVGLVDCSFVWSWGLMSQIPGGSVTQCVI